MTKSNGCWSAILRIRKSRLFFQNAAVFLRESAINMRPDDSGDRKRAIRTLNEKMKNDPSPKADVEHYFNDV